MLNPSQRLAGPAAAGAVVQRILSRVPLVALIVSLGAAVAFILRLRGRAWRPQDVAPVGDGGVIPSTTSREPIFEDSAPAASPAVQKRRFPVPAAAVLGVCAALLGGFQLGRVHLQLEVQSQAWYDEGEAWDAPGTIDAPPSTERFVPPGPLPGNGPDSSRRAPGWEVVPYAPGAPGAQAWTFVAKLSTPRTLPALAASPDGTLYAVGGRQEALEGMATVERYDPATGAWQPRAPLPTPRNGAAAAFGADGLLYVAGGHVRVNDIVGTLEAYDPASDQWLTRAPMSARRMGFGLVAGPDGKLYAIGGSGPSCSCPTVEVYDPRTDRWSTRTPMSTGRSQPGVTLGHDGRIYVFGGHGVNGALASVESYDPITDTWRPEPPLPVPTWGLQAATGNDGLLYIVGGLEFNQGTSVVGRVAAFDPERRTWSLRAALSEARAYPGVAMAPSGKLYVAGGSGPGPSLPPGTLLDSVEVYDTAAGALAAPLRTAQPVGKAI